MKPEADIILEWETVTEAYDDGSKVELRKPVYNIRNPNYGPLPEDLLTSPRVAPPMIGLGLLQAIPESALVDLADPQDQSGDGISGKMNRVWDAVAQQTVAGRFGWKLALLCSGGENRNHPSRGQSRPRRALLRSRCFQPGWTQALRHGQPLRNR